MQVQVLAAPFLFHLPANGPGKAQDGGPSVWTPAIHLGDLEKASGSWHWPGPVPAVVAVWEVNQPLEGLSVQNSAFQRNKSLKSHVVPHPCNVGQMQHNFTQNGKPPFRRVSAQCLVT